MTQRPTTFGELISRLASVEPGNCYRLAPVVATATDWEPRPNGAAGSEQASPFWVVLHSVSDYGLKLLHARPLPARNIAVRVEGAGGDVLQVILAITDSVAKGDLYESTAQFQLAGLGVR